MKYEAVIVVMLLLILNCRQDSAGPSPILSPEQAIADFKLEKGFRVELVAAEPMVQDPVAIAFDANGDRWVVEMRGYMPDDSGLGEDQPNGRIKILRDTNGDGRCDTAIVFLDSLVMPRAVCPVYGGVLVAEPPNLWFYGMDKQRILVDSTYAEGGNPEHQPNGLLPAMDNWIYSAKSDKRYRRKQGQWLMEKTAFRGQWGIAQDDYGRLYYNDNSTTLRADRYQPNIIPPLAALLSDKARQLVGVQLVDNRVYPSHPTPGVNRGYEQGMLDERGRLVNVTSACGPTVYRGDQFPDAHAGNAFVPEPVAQLVKRIILTDSAGIVTGRHPYREAEFMTATDERFRPVNTATAPDGSLYIVDMHRGVIQHATYLTPFLRKQVKDRKLAQPTGLGRIYRILHNNKITAPVAPLATLSSTQLVDMLASPNGWQRDKAQWLLVERADTSIVHQLKQISLSHNAPRTRLHALWALEGLGKLNASLLHAVFQKSNHPQVAQAAILLCRDWPAFVRMYQSGVAGQDLAFAASVAAFCINDFEKIRPVIAELALKTSSDSLLASVLAGGIWANSTPEQVLVIKNDAIKKGLSPNVCLIQWLEKRPEDPLAIATDLAHLSKLERELYDEGRGFYASFCSGCHGKDGAGIDKLAPPLAGSGWVTAQNKEIPLSILLDGLSGPVTVAGKSYEFAAPMPGLRANQAGNDGTVAKILTYIRNSWGNQASAIHVAEVSRLRIATQSRSTTYTAGELSPTRPEPQAMALPSLQPEKVLPGAEITPSKWRRLFNGKNLNGWRQLGGEAVYRVEDGCIVGTTALQTPNSFLVTQKPYSDFILELEVRIDSALNSGIQIRSNSDPNYQNGVFHGYQVEIDPSPRAWSGGIYDESRRGWLYDLKDKPAAQAAFRKNGWNRYRIEARGDRIRTWINDIAVADLRDSMTCCGYIGLQVHSIGNDSSKLGKRVAWRGIRLKVMKNEEIFNY